MPEALDAARFRASGRAETRFGHLLFFERDAPPVFWVVAHGAITPRLVRADLTRARSFGERVGAPWSYVVDTRGVRFAHPWNVVELRKIRTLPNVCRYVVIASGRVPRAALSTLGPLFGVSAIAPSVQAALGLCEP